MQKLGVLILTAVVAFFSFACSRGDSTDAAAPDANSAPQPGTQFTDAAVALREGNRLLDAGETEQAIAAFEQAVAIDPNLAEGYFQLGVAYALIERRDAAQVEATVTPTPDPAQKKAKTQPTRSEENFQKAVDAYKKLVAENENDDTAYFNLGRAYKKLNEDEDAAKALRQAVKLNPENTEYQTELGEILIRLAQYREAIEPLKKAIEIDDQNSRAAQLLDDAEAGRRRVEYSQPKTDDKKSGKANSANANAADSNTSASNSNSLPKPSPRPPAPANRDN